MSPPSSKQNLPSKAPPRRSQRWWYILLWPALWLFRRARSLFVQAQEALRRAYRWLSWLASRRLPLAAATLLLLLIGAVLGLPERSCWGPSPRPVADMALTDLAAVDLAAVDLADGASAQSGDLARTRSPAWNPQHPCAYCHTPKPAPVPVPSVCRNLPGLQAKVPPGLIKDAQGNCVPRSVNVDPEQSLEFRYCVKTLGYDNCKKSLEKIRHKLQPPSN